MARETTMTAPARTSLRTDLSLWLDSTEALLERLETSEKYQKGSQVDHVLSALEKTLIEVAQFFASKAQWTPDRYKNRQFRKVVDKVAGRVL